MESTATGALTRLQQLLGEMENRSRTASADAGDARGQDATAAPASEATLGDFIDALDERAYGFMLLMLAIPCCIPFLYGVPQVVALPILALCAQMALGREAPWLPDALAKRRLPLKTMQGALVTAHKYGGWIERLTHARLRFLSDGRGARITGALLLIPAASILVPAPLTNSTPGLGVAIVGVGLIERDGLLILLGLAIGLAWVFLLVFVGAEAISFAKDWLLARF